MINCTFENGSQASLRHVVMDAIIVKDGKVLLVRRAAHLSHGGKLALPGGFLNRDETCEAGIRREVREETGFESVRATLFKVVDSPDRGEDRQNVTFVYVVEVGQKVSEPDSEVKTVEWYDIGRLPAKEEFAFDHGKILRQYLER